MDFTEPQPLTDVLAQLDAKTPIGSVMRSADWQAMPQQLRDSAFFSAGVTNAAFLAQQQQGIRDMIARARETNAAGESMWKMDRSQFIKQLRVMGEAVGIAHPDGRKGGINEKDITDPLSIARLKLVVNTQLEMAYGQGQYLAAMDEDVLQEWPAWELVRITPKKAPRDWLARWQAAGGTLHEGRMIALKTSPVWTALSRFGKPHPPFDYNSGMGVEEVDRDTTEQLGLMSMTVNEALHTFSNDPALKAAAKKGRLVPDAPTHQVLPPKLSTLEEGLEASIKDMPDDLKKRLKDIFGDQIKMDANTARWVPLKDQQPEPTAPAKQPAAKKRAAKKKAVPAAPAPKKQTKEQLAVDFGAEFGCTVKFVPPAGTTKWGAKMGNPACIKHMQTIADEWRRVREAFPALKRGGIVNTFLCLSSKRGRAHLDGPSPFMSTKAVEWSDASFAGIAQWEKLNKRNWGTERKGSQVQDNFRHELGHTMSTPAIIETFKREVLAKHDLEWFRQNVSEYSATNSWEAIAEAFGICTRVDYIRGTFPPALERFIFQTMLGETK
ncbi:hypothetical protein [Prosthecobacter sp.]|uniref:hypothetical protein n=1 Tax=Prosthecobacter sp. TaxID=1965333 RepID=UPI0037832997